MRNGAQLLMVWVLVGVLCAACGSRPSASRAVDLFGPAGNSQPAVVQTLVVVALADESFSRAPQYKTRIAQRVHHASEWFEARVGLRLKLARIEPWPRVGTDANAMLVGLEEANGAPEADLVILFTAAPPPPRARMSDVVASRYASRSLVIFGLTRWFPASPDTLAAAEARSIIHGISRVFGALPSCDPSITTDDLGFTSARPASWRLTPLDQALVSAHAALDLRAQSKVPAEIARKALGLLETDICELPAVAERRELLEAVVARSQAPDPAGDAIRAGRAALSSGDAATALEKCGPIAVENPERGAARCAGFAASELDKHSIAIRMLRAHLAKVPDDPEAERRLAQQLGMTGDDGAARALLERLFARRPDDAKAGINLGVARARTGDLDGAEAAWRAVLEQHPEQQDAQALLVELEAARRKN